MITFNIENLSKNLEQVNLELQNPMIVKLLDDPSIAAAVLIRAAREKDSKAIVSRLLKIPGIFRSFYHNTAFIMQHVQASISNDLNSHNGYLKLKQKLNDFLDFAASSCELERLNALLEIGAEPVRLKDGKMVPMTYLSALGVYDPSEEDFQPNPKRAAIVRRLLEIPAIKETADCAGNLILDFANELQDPDFLHDALKISAVKAYEEKHNYPHRNLYTPMFAASSVPVQEKHDAKRKISADKLAQLEAQRLVGDKILTTAQMTKRKRK